MFAGTGNNLGVRQQQNSRPTPDRQQSVSGVIDEGGLIFPPLYQPSGSCETDRCKGSHVPLFYPFTAIIECVMLPVRHRYFCVIGYFL